MRPIIIILIIIALIIVSSQSIKFVTNAWEKTGFLLGSLEQSLFSKTQKNNPQEQSPNEESSTNLEGPTPKVKTKNPTSSTNNPTQNLGVSINTFIIGGPEEGEIIEETNRVTFEFSYRTSPTDTKSRITFETKIEGFDDEWVSTSSTKRTITLTPGSTEYTFLVRAKTNEVIDHTPAKRSFEINVSPYFEKVNISSVRARTSSRYGLITLSTRLNRDEEINITGWKTEGKGGKGIVPLGIEYFLYQPKAKENIIIKQGDRIYISEALNPLGKDRSFRPNKCMGYLKNEREYSIRGFSISVPGSCPRPTGEEISHLEPCCREFIKKAGGCVMPNYYSNPRIYMDQECVDFIEANFNYAGCFRNYSRDDNFLSKAWHIYMDRSLTISKGCDTLYLLDADGLFIDKYDYGDPICK